MSEVTKLLIIGGVAGGASAATRARRCNPKAEITIVERGPSASFANCGLPYHLGGEIEKREKLIVASKKLFKERFNIDILTETEVLSINRNTRSIVVKNNLTELETELYYDKLIISTGSKLRKLEQFKNKFDNVFSLWNLNDLDSSMLYMKNNEIRKAVVVGAGFVGLEIVEQLGNLGVEVSLIEKMPQVLPLLDPEMASFVSDELKNSNVKQFLGKEIASVNFDGNKVLSLNLDDGKILSTDIIFYGIGVLPENSLAQAAGLDLGSTGGVKVNEFQQTNDLDIYAVGDVSEYFYSPTQKYSLVPLAGPANRSGRIAGEHSMLNQAQFTQKVQGTSIVRVFNKTVASTGLTEKLCDRLGIECGVSIISALNHASYFPGAKEMVIKTIFSEADGRILGAQIVGEEGVDKRIDVIATLLNFSGTAKDLANLDLAYAPPFGSAKDPLHIIGFTILNSLDKSPKLLAPNSDLVGFQVVDVRPDSEILKLPPIKGAIRIPIDEVDPADFLNNSSLIDKNKKTVVVCHSGKRAHVVASSLKRLGVSEVYNLTGGMMMRSRFPSLNS